MRALPLIFTALVVSYCGGGSDVHSYSEAITIRLKAKESDLKNGVIEDDKNIATETGNPYSFFINNAVKDLGKGPSSIGVDKMTLILGAGTKGVAAFDDLFSDRVHIFFSNEEKTKTVYVGTVEKPSGVGPIDVEITASRDELKATLFSEMLSGNFRVGYRGNTGLSEKNGDFDANIEVTIIFAAYE